MKSINCLHLKSKNFLEANLLKKLLQHYSISYNDGLDQDILTFKSHLARVELLEDKKRLHDLLEVISPVQDAFPTLKKAVTIAMTFGTSTVIVERTFSSLRRIKIYL